MSAGGLILSHAHDTQELQLVEKTIFPYHCMPSRMYHLLAGKGYLGRSVLCMMQLTNAGEVLFLGLQRKMSEQQELDFPLGSCE